MRRSERGSALILMPAGVLILLVLAAMTIDGAATFLAQRHLSDTADAIANNAATSALDTEAFRMGGSIDNPTLDLDPVKAQAIADRIVSNIQGKNGLRDVSATVTVDSSSPTVEVSVTGTVELVFADVIPGVSTHRIVHAHSQAGLHLEK